jgi:ABC-type lipoprotein release transport system permease subunit
VLIGSRLALGIGAAWASTRALRSQLFEVSAGDPQTFTIYAFLLAAVAILACWIPARRATRTDPIEALRTE